MTEKQIEANRRNAQKSTGPRTEAGRAVARLNALTHGLRSEEEVLGPRTDTLKGGHRTGIRSTAVLVRGAHYQESQEEFDELHARFVADLQPVGPVEEMLVDQVVTGHWRLRRALRAEAGEIALSVDGGQQQRNCEEVRLGSLPWELSEDPVGAMLDSVFGSTLLERALERLRASVEATGELTEEAIRQLGVLDKPHRLALELTQFRKDLAANPEGLEGPALRTRQKELALAFIDGELRLVRWVKQRAEERERREEAARQAAAVLPAQAVLDRILRYETKLERQIHRALAQLERWQRRRREEVQRPGSKVQSPKSKVESLEEEVQSPRSEGEDGTNGTEGTYGTEVPLRAEETSRAREGEGDGGRGGPDRRCPLTPPSPPMGEREKQPQGARGVRDGTNGTDGTNDRGTHRFGEGELLPNEAILGSGQKLLIP